MNKLYYPVIGGVETHVRDLALYLPEDVDRKVLACSETGERKVEKIDGVEVTKARNLGNLRSSPVPPGFVSELKAFGSWADLFHFHFPFPTGEMAFLLSGINKPLIVTYHSDIVRQKILLKLYKPFLARFLKRAKVIIATSPKYIETSPFLRVFKEKCRVVPLGIDTTLFDMNEEKEALVDEIRREISAPFVLFVGRLIYYKGAEYLIRAFKEVPEDYKLVIIGSGPLKSELEKLADDSGISRRIVFLDPQPYERLIAFYHACELFVLPSVERSEAFGIVQLEAQACGKPVITTELGTGTSFANLHGVTGIVVPPADVKALSDALNTLLKDDKLRKQLGKNAYERVRKEFDVRFMAKRVNEIYEEVLSS